MKVHFHKFYIEISKEGRLFSSYYKRLSRFKVITDDERGDYYCHEKRHVLPHTVKPTPQIAPLQVPYACGAFQVQCGGSKRG